jgi:dihydrofolate reductase
LIAREVGNIIVGHRTYNILTKQPGFFDLKNVKIVVVATQPVQLVADNHKIADNPQAALHLFDDQEEVLVAGGGKLNSSFLEANLVDEMYLDVEPVIFGKGIGLFTGKDFENKLMFLGMKHITENEIQLQYKIVK